jgi:hypothetical protein
MKKSTLLKVIKEYDNGETDPYYLKYIKVGFIANVIMSIGGICKLYFKNNLPKEYVLDIIQVF